MSDEPKSSESRKYLVKVSVLHGSEWSDEDAIMDAYTAEDAVFQMKHAKRHWPHTILSVRPSIANKLL